MTKPKPPEGLKKSGRALWTAIVSDYELTAAELALLLLAGETIDAIDRLQVALNGDEVLDASSQGRRVHPALPELRQQRIVFARLIAQLRVPTGDEDEGDDDEEPPIRQRRAARGSYRMRSVG